MIGQRIGPYEVLAKLGEGGMGAVYRARDPRLRRDVAIKVLPALVSSDPERLTRFEREGQALAAPRDAGGDPRHDLRIRQSRDGEYSLSREAGEGARAKRGRERAADQAKRPLPARTSGPRHPLPQAGEGKGALL